MRQLSGAALALCFALAQFGPAQALAANGAAAPGASARTSPAKTSPAQGKFCKPLKGEWVGIGEEDTRKEAETRLDTEIASWGQRYNVTPVKAKDRKVSCEIYLKFLNEYFCTANAVVCR